MKKSNLLHISMWRVWATLLAVGLFAASCDDDDAMDDVVEPTGTVVVADQFFDENDGQVMISSVNLSQDGWVVVRNDINGQPGTVIGTAPVTEGAKTNVMVDLDATATTTFGDTYWVTLHRDAGTMGTFNETEDLPIMTANNTQVSSSFMYDFPAGAELMEYDLAEIEGSGVSGIATVYNGANGAYVVLDMDGTPATGVHPAHIHNNTAAMGGGIAISLENVMGSNEGLSITRVTEDDAGTPVTYADLLDYNGYINVHLSADDLGTIVSQGDIGQNTFTGEMVEYVLTAVDNSGVTGTAILQERMNGNTLLMLNMENTVDGVMHPSHIHEGTSGSGGPIVISLNPVDGSTGMSMTEIAMMDDDTPITFTDLMSYNGYINVHMSPEDLTVVSTTNIGANAE